MTSALVLQLWPHVAVGTIHFEDNTSKKSGIGGGGQVSAQGVVHMATALPGCRRALVSTGLDISLLFDTNGHR